jgi:hypothetical protein
MLNHNGGIIQGMDLWYNAYHAGAFNMESIGLDMNNIATVEGHQSVYQDEAWGCAIDYATREVVEGQVNSSVKRSFAYTEAQYTTLCALLKVLHEVLGFTLMFPQSDTGEVVRTRLTDPTTFRGFFGHWHCQAGKWDPGPGSTGRRSWRPRTTNFWPIDLGTPTIRDLRSEQVVEDAPRHSSATTRRVPVAAPSSVSIEWHDGVHLCRLGTPLRPPTARFSWCAMVPCSPSAAPTSS